MPQGKISQPRRWSGSPSPAIHSNSTTPIFARLPVEINFAIISLFCKHCSLQDPKVEYPSTEHHNCVRLEGRGRAQALGTLSALSKTCKWLQLQAQPILHHYFPGPCDCYEGSDRRRQFYSFVRTLISRPDLASAVRCIGLVEGIRGITYGILDWTKSKEQILRTGLRCDLKPPSSWVSNWKPFEATSSLNNKEKQTDKSNQNLDECFMLDSETHAFLIRLALHLCGNARVINVSDLGNRRGRINFNPTSASDIFFKNLQTFRVSNQAAPVSVGCVRIHGDILDDFYGPQPSIDLRRLAGLTNCIQRAHTLHVCLSFLPQWLQISAGSESNSPSASELSLHHDPAGLPLGLDLSLLTCLELVLCVMTGKHLAVLLSGCVNLIDLTYVSVPFHTAVSDPDVHADHAAQTPEISNIIHRRCPGLHRTLRRLALEHITNDEESYYGVYTSLHNLVSLEEIYLGANGLFTTLEDCLGPELDGNSPTHPVPLADILPPQHCVPGHI